MNPSLLLASGLPLVMVVMMSTAPASGGDLWGSDATDDLIVGIDITALEVEVIGPYGLPFVISGLAYDEDTETLYGVNSGLNSIYTINTETGLASLLFEIPHVQNSVGLTWNENLGVLYGTDNGTESVYTYNPSTGDFSRVFMIGIFTNVEGLAFDAMTDTLYGISDDLDRFIEIDPVTGQQTTVPVLPGAGMYRGLSFDPEQRLLYATFSNSPTQLVSLDPETAEIINLGPITGSGTLQGLAPSPQFGDCPDIDGDGFVNVAELLAVLNAWGTDDPDADVAPPGGDGVVNLLDFLVILQSWGPCV